MGNKEEGQGIILVTGASAGMITKARTLKALSG